MKTNLFVPIVVIFIAILIAFKASATMTYAEKTGKDCSYCHINPKGGGELTEEGINYKKALDKGISLKNILRFVVYYLHLLFAIMWFGTILYVHIILKPGYAAKGLPRGELLLGWISIVVMFITGIILSVFHFKSIGEVFQTSFGLILFAKVLVFLLMVISAFFVTFFIGPKMKESSKIKKKASSLEYYDGKEGRSAYIAYKGQIFDVTESKLWQNGIHMNRHLAGNDLTEELKQAPHGEEVLERFPQVPLSIIIDKESDKFMATFYFIAYTNLAFVFIIIFLIALWKW